VVKRIGRERSSAGLGACRAKDTATMGSTRERSVSADSTQILPTCRDRQIPSTAFSDFEVRFYRLCGLRGPPTGASQSEIDAASPLAANWSRSHARRRNALFDAPRRYGACRAWESSRRTSKAGCCEVRTDSRIELRRSVSNLFRRRVRRLQRKQVDFDDPIEWDS
jgi:hypothetical protein